MKNLILLSLIILGFSFISKSHKLDRLVNCNGMSVLFIRSQEVITTMMYRFDGLYKVVWRLLRLYFVETRDQLLKKFK